jgi:outer membrane protein OmpA-like peptidoglycan-associated protein
MNDDYGMTPDAYRSYNKWHWILALILAALLFALPWLFGIGPNSWRECLAPAVPAAAAPAPAATPAPPVAVPAAAAPADPKPAAVVQVPSARVYFAPNMVDLTRDAGQTLKPVIAYLKSNPAAKAVLSGFHDGQGAVTREYNEKLALNRARAVRAGLLAAGIAADRVEMNKPQQTTGTGTANEARRVEVTIRP